ncbi:hypothetical protein FBR02_03885 [Anaerolineae bacterium CFX9]|nr:hypothetical protein [Anaerolineae bacterium CFX9]
MKRNRVREKMHAGQATLGCFLGLGSPNVAELLAHTGFDWLVIETEHNGLDSAEIEHMLMAISSSEAIPLVRVPSSDPIFIQRALDMGALGIVVPMIRTAAEAEAVVRATRYPPHGSRSFGPLRASHYSLDNADYLRSANDNIIVVLILETKEAVNDLEAICAVAGIDCIYLGPFDLCLSLGLDPLAKSHAEIDAIVEQMLAITKRFGIAAGTGANMPDQLRACLKQGFTFIGYGPDYVMLTQAALAGITAFRA